MELGAILFSLAMVLLVAAYVLQPIAVGRRRGKRVPDRQLSRLQAERDRVLTSIQELDMDHSMGKVPEEHYQQQRSALALEGAEILRSIDELQAAENGSEPAPPLSAQELELEAAVSELRGRSAVGPDAKGGFCTTCGEALAHGDRFCANCGTPVEEQVA